MLLSINSIKDGRNALTLNSTCQEALKSEKLLRIVHESVRQQNETGYPQAIILRFEINSFLIEKLFIFF